MACPSLNDFSRFILMFDQKTIINKDKDKKLRYNVWGTTSEEFKNLMNTLDVNALANPDQSPRMKRKMENAIRRINDSSGDKSMLNDIINSDANIEMSIALHELMESVKGEADKARNLGVEVQKISNDGMLPALPLSRIAASIGRKIAYQKGYRFKRAHDEDTAAYIETLYYTIGKTAIQGLEKNGYAKIHDDVSTIMDYLNKEDLKKDFPKNETIRNDVLSVSLVPDKFGITDESTGKKAGKTKNYFLDRTTVNIADTDLEVAVEKLRLASIVTQPNTIELPDTAPTRTDEDLRHWDDGINELDSQTAAARKKLYEKPLFVNKALHGFLNLMQSESLNSNRSASRIIENTFGHKPNLMRALFGLKRSQDFSIDKKESVSGQNLSKATPLDDLVEYYDQLQVDGEPAPLHLPMKIGRNGRLYYVNSVLNPHASKQSRHMLSAGEYTVDTGSADFDYLVYAVNEALGGKFTYTDIVSGKAVEPALKAYEKWQTAKTLRKKLFAMAELGRIFANTKNIAKTPDYVQILTGMQAIVDIRNPVDNKVRTEFTVSADATASGGTLTFMQALGTNENVEQFMVRIGLLKKEDGKLVEDKDKLKDLYQVMSTAINETLTGDSVGIGSDIGEENVIEMLQLTLDLLFNEGKDVRELSKDPTMTFVYGQGRNGAITTMSRSLADRIIDNLDDPKTREYLAKVTGKEDYKNMPFVELKNLNDLYSEIVAAIRDSKLPGELYDIMNDAIKDEYLREYGQRSQKVYNLLKKANLPSNTVFTILPAGAVLSGEKASLKTLKKHGMPLTKKVEVLNRVGEEGDTVLTRKEKLLKTVMDVSTIHGLDAAQLYHSIAGLDLDSGLAVIHDDARGNVQTVRAMEKKYAEVTQELMSKYDIHQQIMEAIAVYDPKLAQSAEFLNLKKEIDATVATKAEILQSGRFNTETDALIGDGKAFEEFSSEETLKDSSPDVAKAKPQPKEGDKSFKVDEEEKSTNAVDDEVDPEAEQEKLDAQWPFFFGDQRFNRQEPRNINKEVADANMQILADESDLIARFVRDPNGKILQGMFADAYLADLDTVTLSNRGQDGRDLDLNKPADRAEMVMIVEHEIVHAATVAYLNKNSDPKTADKQAFQDIQYLLQSLNKLLEARGLSENAIKRAKYIFQQEDQLSMVAEFVSVLGAESEVAAEFYNALGSSHTKGRVERLIQRIKDWILSLTNAQFQKEVDSEQLQAALERTIERGFEFREQKYEEAVKYMDIQELGFNLKPKLEAPRKSIPYTRKASMDYLNHAVVSMLNSRLERKAKHLLGNLDEYMSLHFPLYLDTANKLRGVYDSSPALQQFVHTVTGEGVDKVKKADVLAKYAAVNAQRTELINDQVSKLNTLSKDLSDSDKAALLRMTSDMPLHDYFIFANDLRTAESIEAEAELLRKKLWKKSHHAVRDVEKLVDWNMDGVPGTTIYNLEAKWPTDGDFGRDLRKLMALESIKRLGTKKFEKLLKNEELMRVIKDNSVANALSTLKNQGTKNIRDSLVQDYYSEPFQIKAIEFKDFKMYEYGEETGWKILKSPTRSELGIVYRPFIDSTDIAGAYTDTKLANTDISVGEHMKKYPGVVATRDGHKMLLTKEQKRELGLVENFAHSLVHTTAHSMAIQESQIIRDELLKKETHFVISNDKSIDKLKTIVESDNIDSPWFIKLEEPNQYSNLPARIRAVYMPVKGRASDVKNFNDNVQLVRKDISHWLLGGTAPSLFTNPKLKWAARILKDLVAGAKIGMIVLNPIKIANDNLSNLTYLGVLGLDPIFIAKNYKEISSDFAEYSELQREIFQHKIKLVSHPESTKVKKHLKKLQKRLAANSIGDIAEKGFVNSLGSDLVSRSADTLSGFQADMHKALEYLLVEKGGNRSYVAHFISELQRIGFQAENFFEYLGGIAGKAKSTKLMQQELDQVAARIREIKNENDIVNYVAQFTTSPSSEAVRIGSAFTDLTDVMAKETLYRYLVQEKGMKPQEARIQVLDSFPDYKENMPLSIQQLSDVGILMFPSFWLRIQKAIYRMVRDRPVSLATEILAQDALGTDMNTIFEANVINKSNTFGGFLHMPYEPIGVNSVVPMHIW